MSTSLTDEQVAKVCARLRAMSDTLKAGGQIQPEAGSVDGGLGLLADRLEALGADRTRQAARAEKAEAELAEAIAEVAALTNRVADAEVLASDAEAVKADRDRLAEVESVMPRLWVDEVIRLAQKIEAADNRAMAVDGPCPRTADAMSADDIQSCITLVWHLKDAAEVRVGRERAEVLAADTAEADSRG